MSFRTVFNAGQNGYSTGSFPAFGLIFVCIGALLVFGPAFMPKTMPSGFQDKARAVFSWVFLIFAVFWTAKSFAFTYLHHIAIDSSLREGRFSIVEGPVMNFVPMPYNGHSEEIFVVGNQRFSYSDYTLTSGFHNTASHGGPIREGLYVCVTYIGNLILRLEVAQ